MVLNCLYSGIISFFEHSDAEPTKHVCSQIVFWLHDHDLRESWKIWFSNSIVYRISANSFRGNYSFLEVRLRPLFKGGNYSFILLFVYNFIFRPWIMVANIIIKFIYFVAFLEYMNFKRLKLLKGALSWAPFLQQIKINLPDWFFFHSFI